MKKIALMLIFLFALLTACSTKLENPQLEPLVDGEEIAVMETSVGTLKIRFFPEYAPKSVENFITHAKNGYYDGLLFHRVINGFVVQSGDPLDDGTGGESIWGEPFEDEITPSLHHIRGAVSMANSGQDSNRSQFFIVQNKKLDNIYRSDLEKMLKDMSKSITVGSKNIKKPAKKLYTVEIINEYLEKGGTPFLDYDHTVFGQVYEGIETIDNITKISTDRNERPVIDIVINKVTIEKYKNPNN